MLNAVNSVDDSYNAKIETLKRFCYLRFQTHFKCNPSKARTLTRRTIEYWTKAGLIEKRLKEMWRCR